MKKIAFLIFIVFSAYGYLENNPAFIPTPSANDARGGPTLGDAFQNKISDIQVEGTGVVIHLFPDDTHGNRHQKFLLKLSSGQTLLISHNISLAPRINSLKKGDMVSFYGEYEWNANGGVVHWTHRDPRGKHIGGWLKHNGTIFQ
jgi:hypothetical protein